MQDMDVGCVTHHDAKTSGEFVFSKLRDARAKLLIAKEIPEASMTRSDAIGVGCIVPAAADPEIED
jgi:hypothetical protein